MADNGAILYSELFKDDGGLDKLILLLQQINMSYDNLHSNVKAKAVELKATTEGLSGATSLQREEIEKLLNESQKLKSVENELIQVRKQYNDLLTRAKTIRDTEIAQNEQIINVYKSVVGAETNLNLTKRELNTVTRNAINYMAQEENSYAQLAAKVNMMKVALDKMTIGQRTNSEQGKVLTAQAKEYTEVLKVQDATIGRHQRNVGDYGRATAKLNFATAQIVRELPVAAMRADMFFLAISNNIPMLADQVTNMKNMNKELMAQGKIMEVVSIPKALIKSLLSWNSVMMIGVTLLTVFGGKIVEWTKKLFENTEATKRQEEAQKRANQRIKETAELYQNTGKNAQASITAITILKQRYDELGGGLKAAGVIFANHKKDLNELGIAIKNVSDVQNLLSNPQAVSDYIKSVMLMAEADAYRARISERSAVIVQKAAFFREKGVYKLTNDEVDFYRKATNEKSKIDKNYEETYWDNKLGYSKRMMESDSQVRERMKKERIAAAKKEINDLRKLNEEDIKSSTKLLIDGQNLLNKHQLVVKDKEKESGRKAGKAEAPKDYSKEVLDTQRKLEDDTFAIREDSLAKQLALIDTNTKRELEDAKKKKSELEKILNEDKTLTTQNRKDLNDSIDNIKKNLIAIEKKGDAERLRVQKEFEQKSLDQFNKYTEEQWKETLKAENDLLDANLLAIDNKYNADVEAAQKTIKSRRDLNKELLKLELEMLNAKKIANEESLVFDKELAARIQEQINNVTFKLNNENKKGRGIKDIVGKALGLDEEQMNILVENLNTAIDRIKSSLGELLQSYIDFYDAKIDKQQENVDKAQELVDYEREAKANGYASNVSAAEAALANEQAALEKSQKEKEKYVKLQRDLDAAMQISSLITATANILASYSKIPFIGQVLAIAGIAGMWGTFIAAKATAAQVTSYGEGGYGVLEGGSHASGNDILLGTTKDGRQLRAEGDEGYGVFNRRMTRKYSKILPDIINSINKGIFEQKYLSSYSNGELSINNINLTDTSKMEKGINKLVDLNETRTWVDGKGQTIIKYKNRTTIIK